ncbi:MAG: CooT family nickel-binding protein [Eubacterium sp.]|nr:CooT family nickel-binding protein [Eubacterium sp.]MBR0398306.1 CooT family nickel-binding protein [Eubacterium sp.]
MCLSNIYREQDHTLLMENTSRIDIDGDTIRLRDLFGDVREVRGAIVSADLEQNEVVIRCSED